MLNKKNIAILATCMILFSGLSNIQCNASIAGDVDNNGRVDITDVITINKFFLGKETVADVNRLDADGNGIINSADSMYIMSLITGIQYKSGLY